MEFKRRQSIKDYYVVSIKYQEHVFTMNFSTRYINGLAQKDLNKIWFVLYEQQRRCCSGL